MSKTSSAATDPAALDRQYPSKFSRIRELLDQLRLCTQVDEEFAKILEDIYQHIYGIEQNYRRLLATSRAHDSKLSSLETRYSQLMYAFRDFKHESQD